MKKPLDQIMGHGADNDGIEEFDNPLPVWWLGLFYLTIVWALAYGIERRRCVSYAVATTMAFSLPYSPDRQSWLVIAAMDSSTPSSRNTDSNVSVHTSVLMPPR